jgi:hypothetical protein
MKPIQRIFEIFIDVVLGLQASDSLAAFHTKLNAISVNDQIKAKVIIQKWSSID